MSSEEVQELPKIPELEADYELIRELGRGGTAVVYLARDRELGRSVAIKLIRPRYVQDDDAVARLVREARTVGRLQHPNIVMLLGARRLGPRELALILQFVPGVTLKERVRTGGALPYADAERILMDLGRALAYAHGYRIVHRDIKPENVYLEQESGVARLADFGIARVWDSDSGLTLPGTAIGTPAYMSPEQVDGRSLDGRSDLFSLGLVGYEMLTGERPWAGEGLYNVIYKQKHEELPSLAERCPGLPERLCRAIEGALRKNPDERWRDVREFLAVLQGGSRSPVGSSTAARAEPGSLAGDPAELAVDDDKTIRYRPASVVGPSSAQPRGATRKGATSTFDTVSEGPADPGTSRDRSTSDVRTTGQGGARSAAFLRRRRGSWARQVVSARGAAVLGLLVLAGGGALAVSSDDAGYMRTLVDRVRRLLGDASSGAGGAADLLRRSSGADGLREAGRDIPGPLADPGHAVPVGSVAGASTVTAAAAVAEAGADHPDEIAVVGNTPETPDSAAQASAEDAAQAAAEGASAPAATESVAEAADAMPTPVALELLGGWGQEAPPGTSLPRPLEIRVTDAQGGPVSAVAVRFAVVSGGGAVYPVISETDTRGIARADWTLGSREGAQQVRAFVEGAPSLDVEVAAAASAPRLAVRPSVTAGGTHSCSLRPDGSLVCWGSNESGQLGDGTLTRRVIPSAGVGGGPFASVAAGVGHVCALSTAGRAFCWGLNRSGQLGDGTTTSRTSAVATAGERAFVAVSAGASHTCALTAAGAVYCWGANDYGQLGDGSTRRSLTPARVESAVTFENIAAGWHHTCAIDREGTAYCWGSNRSGQAGVLGAEVLRMPTAVAGGHRFLSLAAGNEHTCGVTVQGRILCWGANRAGQLGDGTGENRPTPVLVSDPRSFATVVAGGMHSCGLTPRGDLRCWGGNAYGQVGDGSTSDRSTPVPVEGDIRFAQVHALGSHTCGRTAAGEVFCWGYNVEGQLGDGTRESRNIPTAVLGSPS